MAKPRVVLYNPRAVFFTMPLALVAIASALDRDKVDVVIIDGRLEADPVAAVVAAARGALCVGVTVLTGAPIHDALAISRGVKASEPDCPPPDQMNAIVENRLRTVRGEIRELERKARELEKVRAYLQKRSGGA